MEALKRGAVSEILDEHLSRCSGLYQVPVAQLAKKFTAAGSAVPDLIRKSGVPLAAAPAAIPFAFIDLVGAGVLPVPWLALRTDSVKHLKHNFRKYALVSAESTIEKDICERLKHFNAVGAILTRNEARWKSSASKHKTCETPNLPEECVILCRQPDVAEIGACFKEHEIVDLECESLFHVAMARLHAIRPKYGEGWLQGVNIFHSALEGIRKKTEKTPWVAVPVLTDAGARAATTAVELMGAGWLPVASPHETQRGSGVYLFRDVTFLNFWNGQLRIDDRREHRLASAESFESESPLDRVIIAFRGLGYKHAEERLSDAASKWFVFPLLPFNAFNVVARLLPGLRLTVIGYRAGSPRTSEAGVLERIVRYRSSKEDLDHPCSRALIARSIERLLDESNQARELKAGPLDICDALEAAEKDPDAEGHIIYLFNLPCHAEKSGNFDDLSGPFRFLWTLLLGVSTRKHISILDDVAEEVLRVPRSIPERLRKTMPGTNTVAAHAALQETDRMVERHLGNDQPNKARNRQRYPIPRLIQKCLHMFGWMYAGVLGVPELLAEWLSKRCRFVAILPLDCPNYPEKMIPTCRTRHAVGSWYSWEVYAHLFGAEETEGSVPIDVAPLLKKAEEALQASPYGWLANKCSEGNELVVSLMRRWGYVSNFDHGRSVRRCRSIRDLLDRHDGRLLVRCLQSLPGGNDIMAKWVGAIGEECRILNTKLSVSKNSPDNSTERELPEDPLDSYLGVFRDVEGIVAAALDTARTQRGANVPNIYLDLSLLKRHFWLEANIRSRAVEYRDSIGDTSACGKSKKGGIAGFSGSDRFEEYFIQLLANREPPMALLVGALKRWEEDEGQNFGETVDGLLADIDLDIAHRERGARAIDDELLQRSKIEKLETARKNLDRLRKELTDGGLPCDNT